VIVHLPTHTQKHTHITVV